MKNGEDCNAARISNCNFSRGETSESTNGNNKKINKNVKQYQNGIKRRGFRTENKRAFNLGRLFVIFLFAFRIFESIFPALEKKNNTFRNV